MRSLLLGSGLLAVACLLSTVSATLQTCQTPTSAFYPDTLSSGCCTSWITKRDLGAVSSNQLLGRTDGDCATSTCCEKKKTLITLDKTGSDIQCGSKFDPSGQDGDTAGGIQYSLGPCTGDTSKTCLSITVTPVKSGGGCYTLSSSISVYINDGSVAPDTSSGNWNFANAQSQYCSLKTGASGCQYWSCEFEQSLWEGKIKDPGSDGICGNTIAVGVHFATTTDTCTQGRTGFGYGSSWFQYEKISFSCRDICDTTSLCCCPCNSATHCCPGDTYCGGDGKPPNHNCEPVCCPGQTRCDTPLCTNNPSPNCCPETENYCGTNGLKVNKECQPECCEGDTRCNNPACTSDNTPCCPDKESYCGGDGLIKNTKCQPACCGGTCCQDELCCAKPSDKDLCPQPQCQYGTGWGWLKPGSDDTNHFVNKLKLCSSSRWGEWFDITSIPFTGDLVVGRGNNDVANGDIVGTVSLSEDTATTVKACFDITKSTAHITSVHVEVSCNPFDSTAYSSSKKKSFNICAPGQWLYKFPPSGCLDWVSSQHDICIKGIPKCPTGHYYAIFHAAVTKNSDGVCTPTTSCWTDS